MTPRPGTSRLAPLAHPTWWAALALLLINDNVLKGAGIVPGWLTGKLSDFAFLVVAPVVLAALLPGWLPRRRPLAVVAIAAVYSAADLSPAFSDAMVALAARGGLRWKLWPDPTDLIALAVLPLTIRVLYRETVMPADLTERLRQRAGVILGAGACLATSAPPDYAHAPFLLNGTGAPETVKVTWVLKRLNDVDQGSRCPTPESVAALLTPGDLDDPRDLSLQTGQVAALDGPPPAGVSPVGVCMARQNWGEVDCAAAIFEAPSAEPVLMVAKARWFEYEEGGFFTCSPPPAPVSTCAPQLDPTKDPGPDGLTLRDVNGKRSFVAGAKLAIAPVNLAAIAGRADSAGNCRSLRETFRATIASGSCTTNNDCDQQAGLEYPADPDACAVYFAASKSSEVHQLWLQWEQACFRDYPECRTPPQPAVCREGHCGPVCPGAELPVCLATCAGPTSGTACGGHYRDCLLNDGSICQCTNGTMVCQEPEADPNCPLTCLNWPGGGVYNRGGDVTTDGGTADGAGSSDGGTSDAVVPGAGSVSSDGSTGADAGASDALDNDAHDG